MMTNQKFLVEGWSIEGHITKVVKRIVMNIGLLILHKQSISSLVTIELLSRQSTFSLRKETGAMKEWLVLNKVCSS